MSLEHDSYLPDSPTGTFYIQQGRSTQAYTISFDSQTKRQICSLLKLLKIRQSKLASSMNISPSALSQFLNKETSTMNETNLSAMCTVLYSDTRENEEAEKLFHVIFRATYDHDPYTPPVKTSTSSAIGFIVSKYKLLQMECISLTQLVNQIRETSSITAVVHAGVPVYADWIEKDTPNLYVTDTISTLEVDANKLPTIASETGQYLFEYFSGTTNQRIYEIVDNTQAVNITHIAPDQILSLQDYYQRLLQG